jgi:gliotoxin/aspirochlorine biosynthesis aminotransferase
VEIIIAVPDGNAEDEMGSGLLPPLVQAANAAEREEKKVRALVLTNPHNPSSRCYTADVLKMTATFYEERDIHFTIDEVYALSCLRTPGLDDPAFMSALSLDLALLDVDIARVHVVWSTSKDFGSSGFRMVSFSTTLLRIVLADSSRAVWYHKVMRQCEPV